MVIRSKPCSTSAILVGKLAPLERETGNYNFLLKMILILSLLRPMTFPRIVVLAMVKLT